MKVTQSKTSKYLKVKLYDIVIIEPSTIEWYDECDCEALLI